MIGYYVHHHGAGHLARATAIARRLATSVTVLSSLPRPAGWEGGWIELARDDAGAGAAAFAHEGTGADHAGPDPTAAGALHWAPAGDDGLRERTAAIAAWVGAARPRLLVADVSVEVGLFARLMGVPLVAMAMPGEREDAAHQLVYRASTAIVGPWPAWAHPLRGIGPWAAKLHCVGAISRFDGRPRTQPADAAPAASASAAQAARARSDAAPAAQERTQPARAAAADSPAGAWHPPARRDGRRRVLVLAGRGGTAVTPEQLAAAQEATPRWRWDVLGPPSGRWEPDPWEALLAADVVVCHAGQNAIAEVAAARRAAIVLPQERPHGEQHATAAVLARAGLATVRSAWPASAEWPTLLERTRGRGGAAWERWSPGNGAERAAALLDRLAAGAAAAPSAESRDRAWSS